MSKKSFKSNNPALQFISGAAQETHDTQEAQQISKTTQGRKGHKLPRINMAFSEENLKHIQLMARVTGCSATEYVNRLIMADRAAQADTVKKALEVLKGE